jgi:hypoxanthine phosphoribosyltransferase
VRFIVCSRHSLWYQPSRRPWRHEALTIELDFESPADRTDFAHPSEQQFARLLDFYAIEWHYEPKSFPIEFDADGEPTGFFTPDFYLPEENLFIEITTMNQKLVTKKNRKIRLLAEHHPEIRCKIFYQRDYLHLLIKYGLETPDDEEPAAPTRIPGPPLIVNLGEAEQAG